MDFFYLVASLLILIALLFVFLLSRTTTSHSSLTDIQTLLNPPHSTEEYLLTQRAEANRRFVRAFDLSNTFVSSDVNIHRTFVQFAKRKVASAVGWHDFRELALRAAEITLRNQVSLPFDVVIQGTTLRVILVGLLGVDEDIIEKCPSGDIEIITSHIVELWSLSKKSDPIPPFLLDELKSRLRYLISDKLFPEPLNIIIPAWETLWRVVAISIAHARSSSEMREAFSHFGASPTQERFRESIGGLLSVKSIIDETMRLYPPSKHIGRVRRRTLTSQIPTAVSKIVENIFPALLFRREYADVGSILRSRSIWGCRTSVFDPYRHKSLSPEQEKTIRLVFGHGHLRCVAGGWAPVAAAVICSAILECVDGGEYDIVPGPSIGGREGWDGWFIISVH